MDDSSTAINQRDLRIPISAPYKGRDDNSINIQANQTISLYNLDISDQSLQNPQIHAIDLSAQLGNSSYERASPIKSKHLEQEVCAKSSPLRNKNRKLMLDQIRMKCGYLDTQKNGPDWLNSSLLVARNLSQNIINQNGYSNTNVASNQLDEDILAHNYDKKTNKNIRQQQQQTSNLNNGVKIDGERFSGKNKKANRKIE